MKIITNDGKTIKVNDSFVIISNDGTSFEVKSTEDHLYIKKPIKDIEDITIKIVPVNRNTIKLR